MTKRGKLEIIKDILFVIAKNNNNIKTTPLLRQSNLSSTRFKEYYAEMIEKKLIRETNSKWTKTVSLTDKGYRLLEKYQAIISFIEEFEL